MSINEISPEKAETAPPTDEIAIRMDKRVDLALSLVVIATGIYICYLASQFRTGSFPDPVTTRGLPYFAGGLMIVAGLFNVVQRLLTWSNIPGNYTVSEGTEDEEGYPSSALRSFGIVALALVWVWLVRRLGYLIITPPVLFGMIWLMNVRSLAKLIIFPLGFTLIIWSVFSQALGIIIPLGPLTALARSWGLTP